MAQKFPKKVDAGGELIQLETGQLITGRNHIAKQLKITPKQARGTLDYLLKNGLIRAKVRAKTYSIYTVVNYEKYQGDDDSGANLGAKRGPSEGQGRATKQESKKEKKVYTDDFEVWWKTTTMKGNKQPASRLWNKLTQKEREAAKAAYPAHEKFWEAERSERKYWPDIKTWLKNKSWEDEIPKPPKEDAMAWMRPS